MCLVIATIASRALNPVAWREVDPVPTATRPFPSDASQLVNGETMATGTFQRYDTVRDLGFLACDRARSVACA